MLVVAPLLMAVLVQVPLLVPRLPCLAVLDSSEGNLGSGAFALQSCFFHNVVSTLCLLGLRCRLTALHRGALRFSERLYVLALLLVPFCSRLPMLSEVVVPLLRRLSFPCQFRTPKRRKLLLDQAFHVVVMALNFLHADCQFVDLRLLGRPLNAAQTTAVDNLRRIFLAFGRSAGEISVPASGRRSHLCFHFFRISVSF